MHFSQPTSRVSMVLGSLFLQILSVAFSVNAQVTSQTPANERDWDRFFRTLREAAQSKDLPPGVPLLPKQLTASTVDRAARKAGFTNASYPFVSPPNGCGPNDWRYKYTPDGTPNANFIPACIAHDVCYMTGSLKSECDTNFLYEMTDRICISSTSSVAGRVICASGATAFYKSVDKFGGSAFQNARNGQTSYIAWLKVLVDIVGKYSFSGTNPNGSKYSNGICVISVGEDGSIEFAQTSGSTKLQGTIQITDIGTINVTFSGSFHGNVTYTLQADGSMIGVWGANGSSSQGREVMLPIQ